MIEVLGLVIFGLAITPVGWAAVYALYKVFRPTRPLHGGTPQEQARRFKELGR